MCIVVYKPVGVSLPNTDILKKCFENNPDGAGFMFVANGKVAIKKGFMKYEDFITALKLSTKMYPENETPYVLHFRISTQGGVRADCTHPFPLSDKMKNLRKLYCDTNIGIAHNGIIPLTSWNTKKLTYNDTMEFITDYMTLIIQDNRYYQSKKTVKLLERLSESKLAILSADGHCELIGKPWIKKDGIFYSNNSFENSYTHYFLPYETFYDFEYDEETGLYNFDILDCPALYGNKDYCELCTHYPQCQ